MTQPNDSTPEQGRPEAEPVDFVKKETPAADDATQIVAGYGPTPASSAAPEQQAGDVSFQKTQIGEAAAFNPDQWQQTQYGQAPVDPYAAPPAADPYAAPGYGAYAAAPPPYPAEHYGAAPYGAPTPYGAPAPHGTPAPYGSPAPYGAMGRPPEAPQTQAILATVFSALLVAGCYTTLIGIAPLVFGIMSLSKANSISSLWSVGDHAGANAAAEDSAKYVRWAWISMAIGFAVVVAVVIVIIALVAAADAS